MTQNEKSTPVEEGTDSSPGKPPPARDPSRDPSHDPTRRDSTREPHETSREPAPGIEHEPEPDGENLIPAKDRPGTL